ncbi:MAG TPA: 23S rRNA (guanosine(2251)-2'-O)-methyltransferase RlmB [Dissulfurispiraceae bacterium]|nr:23S rRNA (guanosine(2251)-2'-O)-methyltransferase RlmB [Dissulfurispiraceae bacterium]
MKRIQDKGEWTYGINPVFEAIKSGRKINTVYVYDQSRQNLSTIIEAARANGIPVKSETRIFFDNRFHKGHQGIAASLGKRETITVEELLGIPAGRGEIPFFVILDTIDDPRNFGAIIRIADAAGVHGVVFQSHRSAGLTPVAAKASAGALEYVALVETVNIKHAMEKMRKADIILIGAEAGTDKTLWDLDLRIPLAMVVGSEGAGLRRTVRDMCDTTVSLPMKGTVNSLNVSVAAGIFAYEVLRQRKS